MKGDLTDLHVSSISEFIVSYEIISMRLRFAVVVLCLLTVAVFDGSCTMPHTIAARGPNTTNSTEASMTALMALSAEQLTRPVAERGAVSKRAQINNPPPLTEGTLWIDNVPLLTEKGHAVGWPDNSFATYWIVLAVVVTARAGWNFF